MLDSQEIIYSEIISNLDKLNYSHVRKISADPVSLYSDHESDSNWYWDLSIPKDYKKDPYKLICYLIVYSREQPYWYSYFVDTLGQLCKKNKYKGKWMLLHKLLKVHYYKLIIRELTSRLSGNDIFGNYFKEIEKIVKRPLINFVKLQKPKPDRAARIRGYRDKGSRKLPHEIHSDCTVSGKNPEQLNLENQYKKKHAMLNFLYG